MSLSVIASQVARKIVAKFLPKVPVNSTPLWRTAVAARPCEGGTEAARQGTVMFTLMADAGPLAVSAACSPTLTWKSLSRR